MKYLKRTSVSPILWAGLLAVVVIGGGMYALKSKELTTSSPSTWKEYTNQEASFSFKYPDDLYPTVDSAQPSSTAVALSENASYSFAGKTCTADYLVTSDKASMAFEDLGAAMSKGYVASPQTSKIEISSHKAFVVSGTSSEKAISSIYAPAGSAVYLAIMDNGDTAITFASCGSSANKSEFDQILSTFKLEGKRTSAAPSPLAVQQQQSALRSRDAQRQSDLTNLSTAALVYKEGHRSFPIHTTCTPVDQLKGELVTGANFPASATVRYLDPNLDPAASSYRVDWPNYCYQSDAQGSNYVIWAKSEADTHKGLNGNGTPSSQGFATPDSFKPDAIYVLGLY